MASGKRLSLCGTLFAFLKKHGHIKYAESATLLLSGKPLADGKSALMRAEEPTWLSRFIVNAPQETLHKSYFAPPSVSALKVISKLKDQTQMRNAKRDPLSLLDSFGKTAMADALEPYGQAKALFVNSYDRFRNAPGLSAREHLEAAMVLYVAMAVMGNVREAVLYTLEYSRSAWGSITSLTPCATSMPKKDGSAKASIPPLGLLKINDGYSTGTTYWIVPSHEGSVLGSMALSESDISDVGPHVSAQHARIWSEEGGLWFVEDLDSTNGTKVVRGSDSFTVENSADKDKGSGANRFKLMPGDQLCLADDTRFMVVLTTPAFSSAS